MDPVQAAPIRGPPQGCTTRTQVPETGCITRLTTSRCSTEAGGTSLCSIVQRSSSLHQPPLGDQFTQDPVRAVKPVEVQFLIRRVGLKEDDPIPRSRPTEWCNTTRPVMTALDGSVMVRQ